MANITRRLQEFKTKKLYVDIYTKNRDDPFSEVRILEINEEGYIIVKDSDCRYLIVTKTIEAISFTFNRDK